MSHSLARLRAPAARLGAPAHGERGGFEKQYQVDLDPAKLLAYQIPVTQVMAAIQNANSDVGAMVIELSEREYVVRGGGAVVRHARSLGERALGRRAGVVEGGGPGALLLAAHHHGVIRAGVHARRAGGRLFTPLAFTKTFAMAAASLLSVTLVPVAMGLFVRGRVYRERANPINRALIRAYGPVIRVVLRHRWPVIVGASVALIAPISMMRRVAGAATEPRQRARRPRSAVRMKAS